MLGAYADHELDPATRRELEGHLIGCEGCRRRVLDLQSEARLLSDLLRDRPPPAPVVVENAAAPAVVTGLTLGLGVLTLLLVLVIPLLDLRLPTGTEWLSPTRWLGVHEMILDLLFTARDRAPALIEFALSVAVLASVASLATFLVGALLRRVEPPSRRMLGVALLAIGWGPVAPADAALRIESGHAVSVAARETVDGALAVSADSLILEGTVRGDLVAFCERLVIRGRVEGDVFAVGREVEIEGEVEGALFAGGEQARISGRVEGGVYLGFDRVALEPDAALARDLAVVADRVEIAGDVGRDVLALVRASEILGSVARHVEIWGEELRVGPAGRIGANLTAHLPERDAARIEQGAEIGGETRIVPHEPLRGHPMSRYREPLFYLWRLVWLAAAFIVALVVHRLAPGLLGARVEDGAAFVRSVGQGVLVALGVPLLFALSALSIVGIPLAAIGLALYAIALYLAGIAVAALIGRLVLRPASEGLRDVGISLLAGLALVTVAVSLPWVGGVVRVLTTVLGLGLLSEHGYRLARRRAPV